MKKRIKGKKLSRSTTARRALTRSQIKALADHGKIETTYSKAKVLKRHVDKLMGKLSKDGHIGYRKAMSVLANDRSTVNKLVAQKKISKRVTGFTRIIPLPPRRGDNVKRGIVEWVDKPEAAKDKKTKPGKKETKKKKDAKSKSTKTKK